MSKPCQNPRSECQYNPNQETPPQIMMMKGKTLTLTLTGVSKTLTVITVSPFKFAVAVEQPVTALSPHRSLRVGVFRHSLRSQQPGVDSVWEQKKTRSHACRRCRRATGSPTLSALQSKGQVHALFSTNSLLNACRCDLSVGGFDYFVTSVYFKYATVKTDVMYVLKKIIKIVLAKL